MIALFYLASLLIRVVHSFITKMGFFGSVKSLFTRNVKNTTQIGTQPPRPPLVRATIENPLISMNNYSQRSQRSQKAMIAETSFSGETTNLGAPLEASIPTQRRSVSTKRPTSTTLVVSNSPLQLAAPVTQYNKKKLPRQTRRKRLLTSQEETLKQMLAAQYHRPNKQILQRMPKSLQRLKKAKMNTKQAREFNTALVKASDNMYSILRKNGRSPSKASLEKALAQADTNAILALEKANFKQTHGRSPSQASLEAFINDF